MSNQNYYRNMIDEILVSSELFEKIVNMNMDIKFLKKKTGMKRFISIAAVCAIVFLVSNGISYAAIGSTWTSKIMTYYGNDKVLEKIEWSIDGDGQIVGESEYGSYALGGFWAGEEEGTVDHEALIEMFEEDVLMHYHEDVIEKRGKIYFVLGKNKIDITDQLQEGEGECDVTVTLEGEEYTYHIIKKTDGYIIKMSH